MSFCPAFRLRFWRFTVTGTSTELLSVRVVLPGVQGASNLALFVFVPLDDLLYLRDVLARALVELVSLVKVAPAAELARSSNERNQKHQRRQDCPPFSP